MKQLLLALLILAIATPALAADLICTVPTASVPRAVELCEEARLRLRVPFSTWNNNMCASYFLRLGLIDAEKTSTRRTFKQSINSAVADAVAALTTTWPLPTSAECGDGILDAEFGEICDDGNQINGDGCSFRCKTE